MSVKDEMARLAEGLQKAPTVPSKRALSALSAPSAMMAMNSGFRDLQAEVVRLKGEAGHALRVRIDLCDDGPYHPTPVEEDRVTELKAQLAVNPQSTPASVRLKSDGRYEIISGRHRKYALLGLGQEEWDVVIRTLSDDEVERVTFYDNLFAPNISDYAKFRGFDLRRNRHGLTLEQLSHESGKSKATINGLMAFGRLPPEVLDVVASNQKRFGYNMVTKLAPLAADHPEVVVEVAKLLASGAIKQEEATAKVFEILRASSGNVKAAVEKVAPVSIQSRGRDYATVKVSAKSMTIRFSSKNEAAAVKEAIVRALEEQAQKPRT